MTHPQLSLYNCHRSVGSAWKPDHLPARNALTRVVIDDEIRVRLDNDTSPVEICDLSGRTLGQFIPAQSRSPIALPEDECPDSEEELAAMRAETGGRTLAEIWKSLGRA